MFKIMTNYGTIMAGNDQEHEAMVKAVVDNGGTFIRQKSLKAKIIKKLIEVCYIPRIYRNLFKDAAKYYLVFKAKDESTAKRCLYAAAQASNGLGFI